MIKVQSLTKKGYQEEYAYTPKEFMDFFMPEIETVGRKEKYIKKAATFDIETTTIKHADDSAEAFMYHWQMCIEGYVVFGRKWEEWTEFIEYLKAIYSLGKHKLMIYVHNLSFEFEFMREFIEFDNYFFADERKPLKVSNEYFEFRCSFMLSNMNLKKFIENTENTFHLKASDDLDYRICRTADTVLNEYELGYCYNDVLGLYEAIRTMTNADDLTHIPLTSTGYVRKDCRKAMTKNKNNRRNFIKMKIDENIYTLLKEAFRGGNTASNRVHTDVIHEKVGSFDLSSSYPFQLMTEYYPMSKFMKYSVKTSEELARMNSKYCTLGRYAFYDVELKENVPIAYIAFAKCSKCVDGEYYNGRVLKAKMLITTLTEIDYRIICEQYSFKSLRIKDFYFARPGYLSDELKSVILNYYSKKTLLKGVEGHEYEYMKSKNKLNAIYGMMVTSLVHDDITINELGEYIVTETDIQKGLDDYYASYNSFLSFQHGVWCTAHARAMLQKGIDAVGMDCVYVDTDSVKYIHDHASDFEKLNKDVIIDCVKRKQTHSVECGGKNIYMGLWDCENQKGKKYAYDYFITLGAKKYAYEINGHIGVTVAGLSKKDGAKELEEGNGLADFKDGKIFMHSGRTVAYYNNAPRHYIVVDGCKMLTASNIAIVDTTYTLGITDTMRDVITISRKEFIEKWKI